MRRDAEFRLYGPDGQPRFDFKVDSANGAYDLRCDSGAESATFSFDTRDSRRIFRVDLQNGSIKLLLHARTRLFPPVASASPDGRYIAYKPDTIEVPDHDRADDVALVPVSGEIVWWSDDSSAVFSMNLKTIEVVYLKSGKKVIGAPPDDYTLLNTPSDHVAFINNGAGLLLMLRRLDSDPGGVIFECNIVAFACTPKRSTLSAVSFNERGDAAVISTAHDGQKAKKSGRRALEVIRRNTKTSTKIAEVSADDDIWPFGMVSPSGNFIATLWRAATKDCRSSAGRKECALGAVIDLRRRQK